MSNRVKFLYVKLRNFMSYGNNMTEFRLDKPGTTLILGRNLDDNTNENSSNGVGKTTLINALSFCVYDKPISEDINKDELVNDVNKKNTEVIVGFEVNDRQYVIHRTRKMKAGTTGNNVYFKEIIDDQTNVDMTLDSMDATNRLIEQTIGLPFSVFKVIVVFAASDKSFLNMKTKEQVEFIEYLFELTLLSDKAQVLKDVDMKEVDHKISLIHQKIEQQKKEHDRYKQQLEAAKKRVVDWEQKNKQMIVDLQAKLEKIVGIDFDKEKLAHEQLKQIEKDLVEKNHAKTTLTNTIKETLKEIKKNEGDLVHLRDAKCPYCLQKYENAKQKIAECESTSVSLLEKLESNQDQLDSITQEIGDFTKKQKLIKQSVTVSNIEELINIKNQKDNIIAKIEEAKNTVNPHLEALEEHESVRLEDIKYEEINKLTTISEHQKMLHKLLTKKDSFIRKALLTRNLSYLNLRVAKYITELGIPMRIEFTHELTPKITFFGRERSFGLLSNGQKARINLALSLAFRDVLQHLHKEINICLLDEVLDHGLDEPGVESAAKLLKQKARDENLSLYIISHRNEIDRAFDRTITIQLENSFSKIVEHKENDEHVAH